MLSSAEIDSEKFPTELPTARVTGMINAAREDRVENFLEKEAIIKLFPEEKNGYDKVKSVL